MPLSGRPCVRIRDGLETAASIQSHVVPLPGRQLRFENAVGRYKIGKKEIYIGNRHRSRQKEDHYNE